MKVSIIASAAVAAILSTGVIAQQDDGDCNPCPDGITVDPDTETLPGRTCGGLEDDTDGIPATANVCDLITADAIKFCCPPNLITNAPESESEAPEQDSTPCSVCPDGIPDENLDIPTVPGKTCEDLLVDAPRQIEGSGICNAMTNSEDICCPFVATTVAATTAVVTTVEATDEIITFFPTAPTPTLPPTNKPTMGPTSRDQLFGNILPTPTNTLDDVESPTRAPSKTTIVPTYSPTTFNPTYSPTYNDLAGRGKPPPEWNLPGDESGALSMGVSSRLGLVAALFIGVRDILFA
mmetsp:Transcript_23325/g.33296  ORF Transcript_23325/g.33296 Transcript_23325/m.33296 type:complete len:294 (+) Transcript_23325:70-951(+)|eukprot:CAMPEP_0201698744 /NCGR_PEP_ID=MMETSP0578-20130828/20600_1 /ASSEMBLY_ACC=CAM_ASM_000663 /TAXON_ID=267565 /ORGANISM="Skeletonema grethea, Strain CCMP 1804" /LENGTH=293 /DNA_ID=CAMNT_0048185355 /DNA_START=20 /DNA_END=901 /DNA_ORIENTATION=+